MALVQVQSGGVAIFRWFLACLQASFPVLMTLFLPLRRRAVVITCLRKVKHRITAPIRVPRLAVPPLALTVSTRKLMYANAAVVDGHAERCDVRASAVMSDDNHDGANVGDLDDILSEILSASSRVATPLDLDLAFGAVDVNDDLTCTSLFSPLSLLLPPIASPPASTAAG